MCGRGGLLTSRMRNTWSYIFCLGKAQPPPSVVLAIFLLEYLHWMRVGSGVLPPASITQVYIVLKLTEPIPKSLLLLYVDVKAQRRQWHPTQVLLPGKSHGWRSLVGCSPWGRTRLNNFTLTFHFRALEKEMATHSSVLAWRIPGKGEPGGLPSMGSHRVGHD